MLTQNTRYALRLMRNSPGFTALAVCTLALGIGANTAIFSVVEAVMLRPLPYADADRLVALWEASNGVDDMHVPGLGTIHPSVSPANLVDYNQQSKTFVGLASYNLATRSLTQSGLPETLAGEAVTWNYFDVLGMPPALGRPFRPEEDRPGANRVVIITDELWHSRFGGNPSIVGRQIVLDGHAHDVIGVMPPQFEAISTFRFPVPVRFLVPRAFEESLLAGRGNYIATVIGRVKKGVSFAQAQADLDAISLGLAQTFPATNRDLRARIAPLQPDLVRHLRTSLLMLLGAAGLVLLVACVNVANLLLARGLGRRRDVAIRMALGASRRQILLELLMRGVVLGVISMAAGLLCGVWTRDLLVALAPATIPRLEYVSLSGSVLAATAAASILSGILASLIPALQASSSTASTLHQTALTSSASPSVIRWRGLLVAAEIAAAVVLATGAGLLVRSLIALNRVPLGYDTERVLVMNIPRPAQSVDAASGARFFEELATRVRATSGVQSAAFANEFPVGNVGWGTDFSVETPAGAVRGGAGFQTVSPDYFRTLGIPLVRGRAIGPEDQPGSPFVAVVSEVIARRLPQDGLGLTLDWNLTKGQPRRAVRPPVTIVGVVGEVRRDGRLDQPAPQVYLAANQTADLTLPPYARPSGFAVRAYGDAKQLAGSVQRAVWAIDPEQPISGIQTLEEKLRGRVADRRFNMALLSSFAALAVMLALIGCYGVVSYAAAQRTLEIGIRLAFGAPRRQVIGLVVKSGLGWSAAGAAVGLAAAFGLARVLEGLLFEIAPSDPLTFATTAVSIVAVSVVASYLPARRAASIDPVSALRVE